VSKHQERHHSLRTILQCWGIGEIRCLQGGFKSVTCRAVVTSSLQKFQFQPRLSV